MLIPPRSSTSNPNKTPSAPRSSTTSTASSTTANTSSALRSANSNNVSVYDNVTLEEGVFCGPSMVFTNVYNPRSLIERKSEYRDTLVKRGATLGANCTIVCGVTIGEFAFIGAGAVINKDVKPYALMVGVPARQIGWMSEHGEQMPLPLQGEGSYTCPHSGRRYALSADRITTEHNEPADFKTAPSWTSFEPLLNSPTRPTAT